MMSRWFGRLPVRLLLAAAALVGLTANSSQAAFVTFESVGATSGSITPTLDAFRTAVGVSRQEINWDGVPDAFADPAALPADYFNTTSDQGVVFSTPGTGFMVSADSGGTTPVLFGFPNDLQTFSAERLFTAVNSNIIDISFFLPGTTSPATTSAFGAIFVDVEVANSTRMDFFDQNNVLIFSRSALISGNQGLSFLGAVGDAGERISRVRLTSGSNTVIANGALGNPNDDLVVMDDFIFAEPTEARSAPEPATLTLAIVGLAGMFGSMRRRRALNRQ